MKASWRPSFPSLTTQIQREYVKMVIKHPWREFRLHVRDLAYWYWARNVHHVNEYGDDLD